MQKIIKLPLDKCLMGLDIGGTLAKLAFTLPQELMLNNEVKEKLTRDTMKNVEGNSTIYLKRYKTHQIKDLISFIKQNEFNKYTNCIYTTGGGAFKYHQLIEDELEIQNKKINEMNALVNGMNFLIGHINESSFKYSKPKGYEYLNLDSNDSHYPNMLISVGSGVSMIKIDSPTEFQRISGTMIGGGTLMGLSNLLLGISDFDELHNLAVKGQNENVDMMIQDIYNNNTVHGMEGDIVASSFGKAAIDTKDVKRIDGFTRSSTSSESYNLSHYKPEDIAMSLITMIAFNTGHLAYLCAKINNIPNIYYVGNFIRNHEFTMDRISWVTEFQSSMTAQALFLKHDGFVGALGALLDEYYEK